MSAAGQLARDGVRVNAVCPGFIDIAMLRSADQDGLLAAREGFVLPCAVTPAEIAGHVAVSGLPQPRKFHADSRETATRRVDILAALHTPAVT